MGMETWSATVQPGQRLIISVSLDAVDDSRITNVCLSSQLNDSSQKSRTTLLLRLATTSERAADMMPVATLSPFQHEQTALDIILPKGYTHELHCHGTNAVCVVGHHSEGDATVLSSDGNESEEEAQPEPSAASKRRGYKDGARGRGTVKEDKKPDAKSKQKKSQADSSALGIQARCTRKGAKPHTAFGQGHTVEYVLTVRVGKTGTVSEHKVATTSDIKVRSDANPKGQLSLDGKPTKGWNAFLQEFMGEVGQNGVKRIRVPPTCTDHLSDCRLGHIPKDQEIVIDVTVKKVTVKK